MAQLPLASSFDGDFIVKLVVVEDTDTMDEVARKTASHSVGRTVRPRRGGVLRVRLAGAAAPLDRDATPLDLGIGALESIEVYYEDEQVPSPRSSGVAPGPAR
jgi:toluene monooxygenase system protein B